MNKNDADEKMVSHSTEGDVGGGEQRSEPVVGDALDNFGDRSGNRSMQVSPSPTIQNSAEQLAQELTPRRAVSYLRVSTREQARRGGREEGFSIPAQRAANKRKAMSIGAIIGKEFTEGGVSATTTRRPALQAMLTYLEEEARVGRPVDYVIVHKLDRLVRNRYDDTTLGKRFDELGVRLVSTSENIDQTPGGLLVHGIMASIAEFYSKNLSNEVKKGMAEKVRGGGCIGRAPLGYRNVITTKNGQEARIVVVDEVRGPLVAWAFAAYASGEWTLRRLAEELTLRGLTTVPTASLPEKPVTVQLLSKVLHNPFYVGEVVYQGVHYAGSHEPLVDRATYETVQTLLATRVNGERTVKHAHYLKSTIYCGICGSRLIVTNVKPRGVVYEYFVCLGRHSKKQPQCSFRATLAEQIEDEIVRLYDRVALRPGQRAVLETALQRQLAMLVAESTQRLTEAKTVRRRLDRERDKLLQAHYADAIPLDVLKREQSRISRELRGVERQMTGLEGEMTERQALVGQALDIAQHMATAYRQAPEHIRRTLNQVLFDKVYITPDDETGLLTAIVRYQPPFDGVLGVRGGDPCLSKEGVEVGDGDSLEASGDDEVTLSQPSDIVVSAPEDVSLHGLPDGGLPAPKPSKNKQKPTSWGFHDVGLSVDSMVALSLPHSKQWEACWRYVMGVVDLAAVPTGRGSSLAEDPGNSLDVAGRADIEQGNRASASAEAASAIHSARTTQDTQQHTATPPRRINRYLRPQLVEEMVMLHQAGQTVAQIATRFGFHRTTVARHLKQAGETLHTNPADPAFQERVREAYAEIGTVKHTAQKLGVSKDTVRKVVRGE